MDKRTVEGKKFAKMDQTSQKMYLLEGIYDRLGKIPDIEFQLKTMKRAVIFMAERQVDMMGLEKGHIWTKDYIKKLKKELRYL